MLVSEALALTGAETGAAAFDVPWGDAPAASVALGRLLRFFLAIGKGLTRGYRCGV